MNMVEKETNLTVVVIGGPNGSGKTTLAPFLLRDTFGLMEYVNADTIAVGLSAFRSDVVAYEAGRVMLKRLRDLASKRKDFAFESTLAGRSHALWIEQLCRQNYSFHLIFLWLQSPEIAVQRVKERVRMGGHDVPEETIYRRYYMGIRNFFRLYRPLAYDWVVYDNTSYSSYSLIASGALKKEPIIHQSALWVKLCEMAK